MTEMQLLNAVIARSLREVPGYGDMTADVAAALAQLEREENERLYHQAAAAQRRIVQAMGREARTFQHGHQVAQIDAGVFAYWEAREGREFWKHELRRFLKKHPECAVIARSGKTSLVMPGLKRPGGN